MGSLFVKSVVFWHVEYTIVSLLESILLLRKQCKLSSGWDTIFAAAFENTHSARVGWHEWEDDRKGYND